MSVEPLLTAARHLINKGHIAEARQLLQQAAGLQPDSAEAWLMLAAVSPPQASLEYAQKAANADPHHPAVREALAWARRRVEDAERIQLELPPSPRVIKSPSNRLPLPAPPSIKFSPPLPEAAPATTSALAPQPAARPARPPAAWNLRHFNWPLLFGGLLVLLVSFVAVFGPRLAPRDPMEELHVAQVGDTWLTAPYAPLAVPGMWLGSDKLGRDVLSQLLWAVRPTMILVSVVALVRLVAGIAVGLASGWWANGIGRLLDTLISAALSAPALVVALAAIAALGTGQGVWVFVVGLSLTGWAETARLAREQTRSIKGQLYVEAANALGGSGAHILARHVLPQIMPLVWMLLAFEISGTLLTTAGLGFLGYYLGDVWIMVTDTAAQRHSGMPELGLMLSTVTTDVYTGPWKMFAAGSMVFIAVLGFNLLGEGLRLRLDPERARRRTFVSAIGDRVQAWYEDRAAPMFARGSVRAALAASLAIIVVVVLWRTMLPAPSDARPTVELSVPGGHLWASERHDPQGTLGAQVDGLSNPKVQWIFEDASGFAGGPVVAADGTVYVAATGGTLYALEGNGWLRWAAALPARPVGAPALGPNGDIYVADKNSGLSAFTPGGDLAWWVMPDEPTEATAGPVVSAEGIIFYPMGGEVQAISPEGEPLWRAVAAPRRVSNPPALDPTGAFVFLRGGALSAKDGSLPDFERLPDVEQFIVGADGRTYMRFENLVTEWRWTGSGVEVMPTIEWDWRGKAWGNARDAGVTASGLIWFLYYTELEDARLVLVGPDGQVAGFYRYPHRTTSVIGFDRNSIAYVCGNRAGSKTECLAFEAGIEDPLWKLGLEKAGAVNGGALTPGRLYVTLEKGYLFAVGE